MKKNSALAALLAALMLVFTGCSDHVSVIKASKADLDVVMRVDGVDVCFEEIRYLALNYRKTMKQNYGEDIFDGTDAEKYNAELEENVIAAAKKNPVIAELCTEYGVDTESDDVKKYVSDHIDNMAKIAGGKAEYKKQLQENFMTDHYLRYNLKLSKSEETLKQRMYDKGIIDSSDNTAREYIESDNFIRTLHVYIQNDPGDNIDENRSLAEKVLDELKNGASIKTMIGRYSEDYYMTTTDGYYFMRGEYDEAYENAAFALEEGGISGVVETSSGFYVIERLEKENDYIEKNFNDLKDRYLYVQYVNILNEQIEKAGIEFTEYGKTVDISKIG